MKTRHQNAPGKATVPAWAPLLVALFVLAIGLNFANYLHPLSSLTPKTAVTCKCAHTKYQRFERFQNQWSAPSEEPRILLSSVAFVPTVKQVNDPPTVVPQERYNRPPPAC